MTTATTTDVTIRVDTESVSREDFTAHWLAEQLRRQRSTCVEVRVDHPDANQLLSSCGCPLGGGRGGRLANRKEQAIFDLWEECGMKRPGWVPDSLTAFLQRLRRLL